MKIYLFCFSFLLMSCNKSGSINNETITKEESLIVKDLIQGVFDELWAGMDSTKISTYHTDDFIILENGEVWDNDRIKLFMRERSTNKNRPKRRNIMDYISLEKYGSAINVMYHNKAEFFQGDSLVNEGSWLESALAIKTSDGWRLRMMHSTWNRNK